MKKHKKTYELLKINIFITILIFAAEITLFFLIGMWKDDFSFYSIYLSGILFFIYLFMLDNKIKNKLIEIKKEIYYINYNLRIISFLILLFIILAASAICLITVNKEAAKAVFIFTLFMNTITMLFPAILLIAFIYFFVPAILIPGIKITSSKKNNKEKNILLIVLFSLFAVLTLYKISNKLIMLNNFENQDKIKSSKLLIKYSTEYLQMDKVSSYAKKLMERDKFKIPFFYTENSFPYENYEAAEKFCASLDARVPNYLEVYHIVFNKFDTFGEKYYWISDKDGKQNLVLHFKNMSFEIIKKPQNIKPFLYCAADTKDENIYEKKLYFYNNFEMEKENNLETKIEKKFVFKNSNNKPQPEEQPKKQLFIPPKKENNADYEKKHVNFSVREVSPEFFQNLLNSGYSYNPAVNIKQEYETNDKIFSSLVKNNSDKIRLCYFPFTDYGELNINQEKEVWLQSFCSPSFDLINMTPVMKTKYEKDSYCYAYGGRLPNIPELIGILKTHGKNQENVKYWVNTKVTNLYTNESMPVLVYYKDFRFIKVEALSSSENDKAYTYCIKNSDNPSSIIANYKSRFANTEGSFYAKEKCSSCYYYEIPDTILQQQ